jgi:23S rRNA pseudouridine2605 synthase
MYTPLQMKNRLSKVLAHAGVASRRAAEQLIFEGKVTVRGKVVLVPQTIVSLGEDPIAVSGQPVLHVQKKVYFLLNKPTGYICSNKPLGRKKLVIDLFPSDLRLFTVGRLDRDTSGLLLVTNDGHFAHRVIHPSFNISKEYLIKVEQEVSHDHLVSLSQGTVVEGTLVKPLRVVKVRKGTLKITVSEGKKREVRLMIQNSGLTLCQLKRIRIGGLTLGTLPIGSYRPLSEAEKELLLRD